MPKRDRMRLSGRGRTIAALVVVGAFYGTATIALTSTDSPPAHGASAAAPVTENVALVGATRTGPAPGFVPPGADTQAVCRFLPGFPYCSPRTVTTTVTAPASTVTTRITQPANTVTTTVTQPASTVTTTVTRPASTVTTTSFSTVTTTSFRTATTTRTVYKTVTVTGAPAG